MKIKELMTPQPVFCAPETKVPDITHLMVDRDCGVIPICDDGRIVGVVTDRDVACRAFATGKNPLDIQAREIMTKDVFTISDRDDVDLALHSMQEHHVRRLPVVHDGHLVGIVSMADLVSFVPTVKLASLVTAVSQPSIEVAIPAP